MRRLFLRLAVPCIILTHVGFEHNVSCMRQMNHSLVSL